MKRLLTILFAFFAIMAMAQSPNSVTAFVADTTTDSETEYSVITSHREITKNYLITIGVNVTYISGTAVVNATPQGSMDNTTFYDIADADTVATGGASSDAYFEFLNSYWNYYRVKYISTGSGVNTVNGKLGVKEKE